MYLQLSATPVPYDPETPAFWTGCTAALACETRLRYKDCFGPCSMYSTQHRRVQIRGAETSVVRVLCTPHIRKDRVHSPLGVFKKDSVMVYLHAAEDRVYPPYRLRFYWTR